MREKRLHIPDIKMFCGKPGSTCSQHKKIGNKSSVKLLVKARQANNEKMDLMRWL